MSIDQITGYDGINAFVCDALSRAGMRAAGFFEMEIFDFDDCKNGPPISIHRAALQLVTDKFVEQFQRDCDHPAMRQYYHIPTSEDDDMHVVWDDERCFTPNALAILMAGIKEYAGGLNPAEEEKLERTMHRIFVESARDYAWQVYLRALEGGDRRRFTLDEFDKKEVVLTYEKKKDIIEGLVKIERFIRDDLYTTRNDDLTACFSLAALKTIKTVDERPENLPSISTPSQTSKTWLAEKSVFRKLLKETVEQIRKDMEDHNGLFGNDPLSPAARAILLYGIEFATRDALPRGQAFTQSDITADYLARNMPELARLISPMRDPIDASILREAAYYGECINQRTPSSDIFVNPASASFRSFRL